MNGTTVPYNAGSVFRFRFRKLSLSPRGNCACWLTCQSMKHPSAVITDAEDEHRFSIRSRWDVSQRIRSPTRPNCQAAQIIQNYLPSLVFKDLQWRSRVLMVDRMCEPKIKVFICFLWQLLRCRRRLFWWALTEADKSDPGHVKMVVDKSILPSSETHISFCSSLSHTYVLVTQETFSFRSFFFFFFCYCSMM